MALSGVNAKNRSPDTHPLETPMKNRVSRTQQHLEAAGHLLRWFLVVAVWAILTAIVCLERAYACSVV